MTRFVKSCLTLANTSVGRLPQEDHREKSPSCHRQQPREPTVQPGQLRGTPPDETREDGDRRKNTAVLDNLEPRTAREREVFRRRPVPWMLGLAGGADEAA